MYKCLLILGSPTNSTQSHFSSHKAVCVFVCVCLCDYHKQCSALCMGACFLPISSLLFTCGNVLFSWLEPKPVPIESSIEIHLVNVLNGHQELKRIRLHHLNLPGRHTLCNKRTVSNIKAMDIFRTNFSKSLFVCLIENYTF